MNRTYVKSWMPIPLYPGEILFCVSESILSERKAHRKDFGPWEGSGNGLSALCSYDKDKMKYGIFLPPGAPPSLVAHEVWHATNRVLESLGITQNDSGTCHEMGAYLCEWITQKCHDALDRARLLKNKTGAKRESPRS